MYIVSSQNPCRTFGKYMPAQCAQASHEQALSTPQSGSTEKVARLTELTTEQKESIANMTKPSDLEYGERKRQYASLRRAIIKDANPALVAKFQLANDAERFLGFAGNIHVDFLELFPCASVNFEQLSCETSYP